MKILFIDDNEMMRLFFRDVFWVHGLAKEYQVTIIDNHVKGEELIADEKTRPDVIFLDLLMPVENTKNGLSMDTNSSINFLKRIKSDEKLKKIKVVIFSSFQEKGLKEKLIGYGADYYLVKNNFMPKDIIDFVQSLKTP